jgi:hypothetical protein
VIAHNPLPNLIAESTHIHTLGNKTFSAEDAFSYFFEFTGKANLKIMSNGNLVEELELESKNTYTEYKGLIEDGGKVELIFESTYPSAVKNVALYAGLFESEMEIPEYAQKVRYYMKDLASDFYMLADNQIYYEGNTGAGYIQTSKYYRESDNVLVLDRNEPGSYTIYYRAYPEEITAETDDEYELPLDKEVAVLMPLYMASQLYKDDDNGIATSYRNEFEVALESLIDSSNPQGYEQFTSESGWW